MKKEQKREKQRRSMKEKGITLVALVVTIIILLILAGVTLNGALSENGLFQRAKKAVNEYKKAEETESKAIEEIGEEIDRITFTYNDYVGCYVDGYNLTEAKTCTIDGTASGCNEFNESSATGNDKVEKAESEIEEDKSQKFTTEADMGWRIWDYNKSTNTIRLISDKPTSKKLALYGANGYNNGVWAINEICKECYAMNEPGISVANLRRTDIQKVSTYDYTQYKHKMTAESAENAWEEVTDESIENTIRFGETKTYQDNHSYPTMWKNHDKNWTYKRNDDGTTTGKDDETIWEKEYNGQGSLSGTGSEVATFKQSSYDHNYKDRQHEFIKNKYYDLLFKDKNGQDYLEKDYWLAGCCVFLNSDYCDFNLQALGAYSSSCGVGSFPVYTSSRYWSSY